jgi:hypothetical protein
MTRRTCSGCIRGASSATFELLDEFIRREVSGRWRTRKTAGGIMNLRYVFDPT